MAKRSNGEGTIYQRKSDGRYASSISIGRGKHKHFLGHSRAEVAAQLAAALADQNKGLPIVSSNLNIGSSLKLWLESVKSHVRPQTYDAYGLNVRRLSPLIGKTRLTALSPVQIERAYTALLEGGLSRRTVEQAHTVLHGALEKAVRWGYVGRNPADAASTPRPERTEMKTLSEEDLRVLFEKTVGDRLHSLWVLLATTGLRLARRLPCDGMTST